MRRLREQRGLTQEALATKAGIHRVYLAQIEASTKVPSIAMLEKLAKALRVKARDLLADSRVTEGARCPYVTSALPRSHSRHIRRSRVRWTREMREELVRRLEGLILFGARGSVWVYRKGELRRLRERKKRRQS